MKYQTYYRTRKIKVRRLEIVLPRYDGSQEDREFEQKRAEVWSKLNELRGFSKRIYEEYNERKIQAMFTLGLALMLHGGGWYPNNIFSWFLFALGGIIAVWVFKEDETNREGSFESMARKLKDIERQAGLKDLDD